MSNNPRTKTKGLLATTAIAGVAAAMLASGMPIETGPALAEAVKVEAPKAPSFADVVEAVSPAVVSVRVSSDVSPVANDRFSFNFNGRGLEDLPEDHPLRRFFDQFGPQLGPDQDRGPRDRRRGGARPVSQGSGFFISEDGFLVTNNHVIDGGANFTVIMDDGTEIDAELVGSDSRTDLAVLKVEEERQFTYVDWADDSQTRVGDWVVAVGNPFGLGGSVTAGIISARGRDIGAGPYDDFIQVDAAVNRGNSGGPTFNLSGEVIGVNTAIFSPSGGNVGIAFAIPASIAKQVVSDLMEDGTVERGWLGVQIQPVNKEIADSLGLAEASGALVNDPQPDAPAAKAGIRAGDVVTEVDGDKVKDPRELAKKIGALDPGQEVELTIWRDGKSMTRKITLGTLPQDMVSRGPGEETQPEQESPAPSAALADFGLTVVPSDDGRGLVVTDVAPDSSAAERGMQAGDVILSVNNQEVKNAGDVTRIIGAAADDGRKAALFQVENENRSRFVALPIEQG